MFRLSLRRLHLSLACWIIVGLLAIAGAIWMDASGAALIAWALLIVWSGCEAWWVIRRIERRTVAEVGLDAYRSGIEDGQSVYEARLIATEVRLREADSRLDRVRELLASANPERASEALHAELVAAVSVSSEMWVCPDCEGGPGGVGGADCVCAAPLDELDDSRVVSMQDFRRSNGDHGR